MNPESGGSPVSELIDWLGLSGLLAIFGVVFGYGHLHSRVKAMEEALESSEENAKALARLEAKFEERTAAILRELQALKS